MKFAIRRGVFETNSSSSHSITIIKEGNKNKLPFFGDEEIERLESLPERTEDEEHLLQRYKEMKVCDEHISYVIKSPLAKLVWFLGMVQSAEDEEDTNFDLFERDSELRDKAVKNAVLEYVETQVDKKTYDNFVSSFDVYGVDQREFRRNVADLLQDNMAFMGKFRLPSNSYGSENQNYVRDFKDYLIDAYCEKEGLTREEVKKIVISESCKNVFFESILKNEPNLDSYVESLKKYNNEFKTFSEANKDLSPADAFNQFVSLNHKKNCMQCPNGNFSCRRFFKEGEMTECDCGFENYDAMHSSIFMLNYDVFSKDLEKTAKEFLTDKFYIEIKELMYGNIPVGRGEEF